MVDQHKEVDAGFWQRVKEFFAGKQAEVSLRESLEEALEEHEEDTRRPALGADEREMLFNVLEYGILRVHDVMVPRADIVAVPQDSSFAEMIKIFAGAAHSRMPVYRENLDDVQGMVHVKDALKVVAEGIDTSDFTIKSIQRSVLHVPPSMKVVELLNRMRRGRTHMAVVIDEYGGTDGLVTVEDIVEEVIGEIEDEHDEVEAPDLVRLAGGGFDADARLEIEELEDALGVSLLSNEPPDTVDTLGGLVFALAGCVPEIGEVVLHDSGYAFEVVDADPRRIQKVRIHLPLREQSSNHAPK
ncbi:MAG: magnesium/cobalt efflux protein [Kordiimonadales bacterium]|nr:MAG: magnesium/cobalt efflux protein [Kordiimonadales bacterium]